MKNVLLEVSYDCDNVETMKIINAAIEEAIAKNSGDLYDLEILEILDI